MSFTDVIVLSPLLIFGALCVLAMVVVALRRQHSLIAAVGAASCLAGLAAVSAARSVAPRQVTELLLIDDYALMFMSIVIGATLVVGLLSVTYPPLREEQVEEYYLLMLLASFGGLVMVAAAHFATFFLGLEIIGVSLYGLIGYLRRRKGPLEAALKYLVLSGTASAFLLFGMALIYFDSGGLAFSVVVDRAVASGPSLWTAGFLLMLVGIGFKLGFVPFHPWMPWTGARNRGEAGPWAARGGVHDGRKLPRPSTGQRQTTDCVFLDRAFWLPARGPRRGRTVSRRSRDVLSRGLCRHDAGGPGVCLRVVERRA